MKNIFYILLLLPTIIFAQYPSNSGQKITLGEQSTADGLVWRGIRADTTSKIVPFSDTSAYIILDTVEKTLWLYKAGQIPKWQQVGGSTLDTATMLLPYWRSGIFSGVLPVANGGTNTSTEFTQGSVVFAGASGTYTQNNSQLFFDNTNNRLNIGQNAVISSSPVTKLSLHNGGILLSDSEVNHGMTALAPANVFFSGVKGNANHGGAFFRGLNDGTLFSALGFEGINYTGSPTIAAVNFRGAKKLDEAYGVLGNNEMVINFENLSNSIMSLLGNGHVGIGTIAPTSRLHVVGNGLFTGSVTANSLSLTTPLPVLSGGTGLTSLGTGVATFLGTPTSANLASAVTNETGSGSLVFATSPTIQTATITGGDGNQLFITNGGQDFTQLNFGQNSSVKSFFAIDHRSGFQGFVLGNQGSQPLYRKVSFRTNGATNDMIITNSEVWIGYTTDQGAYALQINGQPQATSALFVPSDEKFKENITPLNKGLEIVNKLKPVTFNFISDTKNNFSVNEEVGFIAQDVDRALSTETFAKSIVHSADDSEPTSTMGLATQNLIPILVKAIQEQQALIKALEQRILTLENK